MRVSGRFDERDYADERFVSLRVKKTEGTQALTGTHRPHPTKPICISALLKDT